MNKLSISAIIVGALLVLTIFGSLLFRATFLTFVEPTEFGYSYDYRNGQMDSMTRSGYFLTCPMVYTIHTIDLRPTQVAINANSRVLNAKLVQFDKRGWRLFVSWHGRADYANTSSGGVGDAGGGGNLNEILKSYAYDGTTNQYPFLKVLRELKNDEPRSLVPNYSENTDSTTTK